eukprot:16248-Heterococcus_DN1.PRE.4
MSLTKYGMLCCALLPTRVPKDVAETLLKKAEIIQKPITNGDTEGGNAAATLTDPSPVMCLSGMVTISDLLDDTEYEDICQDVKEECQQYAPVQSVTIPRPDKDSSVKVPGLGDIFVEFADSIGATAAIKGRQPLLLLTQALLYQPVSTICVELIANVCSGESLRAFAIGVLQLVYFCNSMAGRTFAGSTVRARFFPLQQYMSGNFSDKPAATAAARTAASTTTTAASSGTPGFVILNADADGPQLPMKSGAASTVTAADDDMGEMPDFDAMDYSSYAYGSTTDDAGSGGTGNGSAAAGTAAAGGAEEYDPFAAADEVD